MTPSGYFDPSIPPLAQIECGLAGHREVPFPKGKNRKFRFALGNECHTALSEVWTISSRKNDVYLCCESMRGRIKLSAHGSGVCQLAFDDRYAELALATPRFPLQDRTIRRWKRLPTPEVGPTHLASVFISAFETWDNCETIKLTKPAVVIPPPPPTDYALLVSLFISRDDPIDKCQPYQPEDIIVGYFQLDSAEFVTALAAPFPLTSDYFEARPLSWFMGVGSDSESEWSEARGISSVSFEGRPDGGVDFHSRHNMMVSTMTDDARS